MTDPGRVVAVVLAAGAGSRFGGRKLLAPLDGRPLVVRVVEAARAAGVGAIVVVTGCDADDVEAVVRAAPAASAAPGAPVAYVRNGAWASGLASSVRAGLRAAEGALPDADAALLLLGDQPLVGAGTIRALIGAPEDGRPIVGPRYAADAAANPVLLRRAGWALAERLEGDRGLGPLIAASPELVARVAVPGDNPDVDTADDLARLAARVAPAGGSTPDPGPASGPAVRPGLAEAAWFARVRENGEQSARVRETPEGGDFYGPVTSTFVADPRRTGDAVLDEILAIARPDDRWLDIGAGAGRFALPLALRVREVIAVDPSPSMLEALRAGMEAHGVTGVRTIEGRWPADDPALAAELPCDASLIAHVGYDIEEIGAFLDAMEAATTRVCVAVMSERVPSWVASRFWPAVHDEARSELPALAAFLDVLRERGREPSVVLVPSMPRSYRSRDDLLRWLRNQLFVEPGSARDARLVSCVDAWVVEGDDGILLEHQAPVSHGVVRWVPRG